MANEIVTNATARMRQSIDSLQREFGSIRAGRANASLLDRITVEYYGAPTPLNQLAGISVPEARVLLITPFDKTVIDRKSTRLNSSHHSISPQSDGNVIRL